MNTRNRSIALLALAIAAGAVVRCNSPSANQTASDLLKAGGEIASEATGDPRFKKAGSALAKGFSSAEEVPPETEHYIGRSVGAAILAKPTFPLLGDSAVTDYVNQVGLAVALAADPVRQTFKGYRFAVVKSDELNAFAAPGGFVFVTTGILKLTKSEDELAGVLAHEISHVTLKHGLQAIQQANLVEAGNLLAKMAVDKKDRAKLKQLSDTLGRSVQNVVFTLLSGGYGQDKEDAADRLGAQIASDAGYSSHALREFLSRMPNVAGAGGWSSTHPAPEHRVANLSAIESTLAASPAPGVEQRTSRHAAMLARLK